MKASVPNVRAFTLIELMISIALVLALMIGVNYVFSSVGQATGLTQAVSRVTREMQGAQAIMARLAGYTEKLEVRHSGSLDSLSDAELEQEVSRRLGLSVEQLRGLAAKPVVQLPSASATITPEGEWASQAPAT